MEFSKNIKEDANNYEEYNRNNNMINKIRFFNNRYDNIDNINDSYNINNNANNNLNQNYQNQNTYNISQNENINTINNNNSQNYNINNNNNLNENMDNNINNSNMINTLNNNNRLNFDNGNYNLRQNQNINYNDNYNEQKTVNVNIPSNNNNLYKSQDINKDLNDWVRSDLESRGLHVGRSISPRSIRMSMLNKKKTLLDNIQAQMNLRKKTKLEELNRRKEEDAKYLQDMVIFYPFGRGGGGAPNRDKSGNVLTYRRALISDPKYNFASINVDDDYDEVWNKEKRIGRFYKNTQDNFINDNNNINQINDNNNNYYNPPPQQINNNRPYSTIPRAINMNQDFNNNNNIQFRPRRRYLENNNQNMNMSMRNINANNELLLKLKEQNELLEKQLEEERENERLRKELEKEEAEHKKILEENKKYDNVIKEETETIIENNTNNIIDPDSIILDKNAIERINRSEIESRNKLNNEIYRLRSQMQDQQMLLYQQISNLKTEAEKANSEREEALREIERLKLQIYQDNNEERKKRYIHHVIVTDDGDKNMEKSIQTEQPKNNEDTLELNKLLKKNIDRLNYLEEIERLNAIRRSPPSNYELDFRKNNIIPEKEEDDEDLYEIEISKVHN